MRHASTLVPLLVIALAGCASVGPWRVPSPDHRTELRVRPRHGAVCVQVGPRKDGCFQGVAGSEIAFSPDSRHVAYPARTGDRWRVIRDGIPGPAWEGVASLLFDPGGERLAYAALDRGRWRVVLEGTPGEAFDSLDARSLVFSGDGRHSAYIGWREGAAHIVRDGVAGPAHAAIGGIRMSRDGAHLAYVARDGSGQRFVLDGKPQLHDEISELVLSADGRHAAYAGRDGPDWFVILDGSAQGPYRSVRAIQLRSDGRLFYIASLGRGEFVMGGAQAGPIFDSIPELRVSAHGEPWGCLAREGAACRFILGGATVRTEPRASNLVLSGDGKRYAYLADRGHGVFVVDDRGARSFPLVVEGSLLFCADPARWACLAGEPERRKLFVVVEGIKKRRAFRWVEMVRLSRRPAGDSEAAIAAARAWVAAEAELLISRLGRASPEESYGATGVVAPASGPTPVTPSGAPGR